MTDTRIGGSNRMLTMREAAEYIGYSYYRFARHYRSDWQIRHAKVGQRILFRQRWLDAFLEAHERGPETDPGKDTADMQEAPGSILGPPGEN